MLNTHFLFDFGDLDKSFSLDNAHASMALRSLNHDFIIHEALVLVLTFIILKKLFNRVCLEKTGDYGITFKGPMLSVKMTPP